MSQQIVDNPIKCGYCGYIMTGFLNNLLAHSCYQATYNSELHEFSVDDAGMLVIVNKVCTNEQETSVENECSSGCISGEVDGNNLNEIGNVQDGEISDSEYDDDDDIMRNDPSGKKLSKAVEVYGPFASGKYDESLIGQVQSKPALYDSRLPTKQRAKKVKADLWKLISNSFGGGEFTPVYASRRWAYLRGCYIKARNKLMKEKAAFERSGAASNDDIKSSYRYYEAMSFLNEPLTYKSTISSLKLKRKNSNNISNKENMELKKSQQTSVHSSTFKEMRYVRPTSALSNNTVASESSNNDSEERCVSPISQSASMPEVSPPSISTNSTVSPQALLIISTPHGITQEQSFSSSDGFCTGAQPQVQRVFQQRPVSNVLVQRQIQDSTTLFPSSSNDYIKDSPSQEQSSGSKRKRTTDLEMEMIKYLKKEPKEMDEIDNFAMRVAAGMRRLSYKSRAKLEIEFLTRLQEEEHLQDIDAQ